MRRPGFPNSDSAGYHETITQASLRGAAALAQHVGHSLAEILEQLMAGPLGDKRWPLAYWSEARLMSAEARRAWVEPDLAPLPWPPLAPPLAPSGEAR